MKNSNHLLLTLAIAGAFSACKKDDAGEVDLGYDYFPQNIGHWVEYKVDSIRVKLVPGGFDTTVYTYPLREMLVEDLTDGEGRACQRVVRYLRDDNNTWLPKDVWWQTRDNVRAERSEENLRRVKLIFPPRAGTEWDTNAPNTDDEFELEYEDIDQPITINGLTFEKTVSVVSTFEDNFVQSRHYEERYAKGVGMITHEMDSVNHEWNFQTNTWNSYDRWYVKYTVTGYGN